MLRLAQAPPKIFGFLEKVIWAEISAYCKFMFAYCGTSITFYPEGVPSLVTKAVVELLHFMLLYIGIAAMTLVSDPILSRSANVGLIEKTA